MERTALFGRTACLSLCSLQFVSVRCWMISDLSGQASKRPRWLGNGQEDVVNSPSERIEKKRGSMRFSAKRRTKQRRTKQTGQSPKAKKRSTPFQEPAKMTLLCAPSHHCLALLLRIGYTLALLASLKAGCGISLITKTGDKTVRGRSDNVYGQEWSRAGWDVQCSGDVVRNSPISKCSEFDFEDL